MSIMQNPQSNDSDGEIVRVPLCKVEAAKFEQDASRHRLHPSDDLSNLEYYFTMQHTADHRVHDPTAERPNSAGSEQSFYDAQRQLSQHLTQQPQTPSAFTVGAIPSHSKPDIRPRSQTTTSAPQYAPPPPPLPLSQRPPPLRTQTLQTKIIPIKSGASIVYERVDLGTSIPSPRATQRHTTFPLGPPTPRTPDASGKVTHDLDSIDLTRLVLVDHGAAGQKNVFSSPRGASRQRAKTEARGPRVESGSETHQAGGGWRETWKEKMVGPRWRENEEPARTVERWDPDEETAASRKGGEGLNQDAQPGSLVADAVAKIKEEQQRSKKMSIMGIFKRS